MPETDTILRVDTLQNLTARERMQGRMNLRAAKMAEPVKAIVYGLALNDLTSSLPGGITDDDGPGIPVMKTAGGNWSSDGNDTAPLVGPWLFLERVVVTDPEFPGELDGDDEESGLPFPEISQDTVEWRVSYWDDNSQDMAFDWRSEEMAAEQAEDLFAFRYWDKFPNTEDTYWEDDAEASEETLWIQPVEPPPEMGTIPGLSEAMGQRLKFVAISPVTDPAMNAAGIFEQMEVSVSGTSYFIPFNSFPWP